MAPKLHTSQIFKGRAYEPKYRAYGFCLNKKRSKFNLAFRSNFFKTWKKYYIPEICKNSKTTQLRMHQKRWIHFPQIFLCVTETHAIILLFHMFLWRSFTNSAWSHGINERNGWMIVTLSVANTDFFWRSKMQLFIFQRVVSLYIAVPAIGQWYLWRFWSLTS